MVPSCYIAMIGALLGSKHWVRSRHNATNDDGNIFTMQLKRASVKDELSRLPSVEPAAGKLAAESVQSQG
jgi:hypothetical protein